MMIGLLPTKMKVVVALQLRGQVSLHIPTSIYNTNKLFKFLVEAWIQLQLYKKIQYANLQSNG